MKKLFLTLFLLTFTTISWAGAYDFNMYLYVENPDPSKFEMHWSGPGPNCADRSPQGYETKGWIAHNGGSAVYVWLVLKENPDIVVYRTALAGGFQCNSDNNCAADVSDHTYWTTIKSSRYSSYRTWACG